MADVLDICDLRVRYGPVTAVRGVDLHVAKGEICCIVGPNGAGKSSTLLAIAGGIGSVEGAITLDGRSILGLAPEDIAAAGLSLVPEGRNVFASLTVKENLFLGTRVRARQRRADGWDGVLDLFPVLRERLHMPAGRLSGGEQQQLVIARALLTEPSLLLLDEPSLGLSPKMIELVMDAMRRLQADGMTVLIVEQSLERALSIADRVHLMRNGQVELSGTSAELRGNPDLQSVYFGIA